LAFGGGGRAVNDDFDGVERFTREQALETAGAEVLRGLSVSEVSIRYVAFVPEFEDYCLCEFVREDEGWVKVIRTLPPSERLVGEEITDDRIIALARSGNKIFAIRLFRAKHQVGLREGMLGVESLLKHAEPGAAADGGV
jgi:hypothetical protein